jgi:4-hydroxythreonine-4-phosphate dehydrogenase
MANHPIKPLALTLGEPAGIGPDITIAAWLRRRELNLPAFYLLGDEAFIARRAKALEKALGADIRIASVNASEAAAAFTEVLPVIATGERATAEPGKPDEASAPAALASIRQAVGDVRAGRASAVVTNPIAKSVL